MPEAKIAKKTARAKPALRAPKKTSKGGKPQSTKEVAKAKPAVAKRRKPEPRYVITISNAYPEGWFWNLANARGRRIAQSARSTTKASCVRSAQALLDNLRPGIAELRK